MLGEGAEGVDRESYCLIGAIGHDFYEGEREGAKGFPRFTDPRLRAERDYGDYIRMATERSLRAPRRRALRPAAAAQPRPHRLHAASRVGGDGGGPRGGADAHARRRAGTGERVHARPDRLLRALRRADRLGDGDPQPDGAVAGRAGARRRRRQRREPDHPRGRLRRPVPRRRAAGARLRRVRPPQVPPRRLGGGGVREARADAPLRRAPRAEHAAARLPVEPRPPGGALRRAHADPGERRRTRARSRTSARSSPRCRPRSCSAPPRWRSCARSATTPGAWR